jgi:ketosteroid isomerase-like protein|tara:strand:- start:397 stop:747 length:351 start_codon:yes stop_codon:yes gene_type:complete
MKEIKPIFNVAVEYFKSFQEGNIRELSKLYHDDIHLVDWNGEWKGKETVLKMNKGLFDSNLWRNRVVVHDIDPLEFNDSRLYCKISITVGDDVLKVIDILDFDEQSKIIKIEAFNG